MKITFVGGGNMAKALLGGLMKRGYSPSGLRVVEQSQERCDALHDEFAIRACTELEVAIKHADVVILAVKPQQLQSLSHQLKALLKGQLIISIAAGIRTADLSRWLDCQNIVRCMPNTPALIRSGVTGLYALPAVRPEDCHRAEAILAAVGSTLWLEDEAMLDAVTAVSGSGPAYVFYFLEAIQQAAYELGFDEEESRRLALDTFMGAVRLAESSPEEVAVLRDRVTSKNGTTERALKLMEAYQVKKNVVLAIHAAAERAQEMGNELGKDLPC